MNRESDISTTDSSGSYDMFSGSTSSPERLIAAMPILYAVLVFGLVNIINGIWHSLTGRRNMLLLLVFFGLAIGLFIAAEVLPIIFT